MADEVVIVALGDSLTAGYGLQQQDGFVPQMQGWLDAHGMDVEVRNAGVSGDTTAGGLARTDWSLTSDVDAMIVALGGNDLLRGIDPALSRSNIEGILQKAVAADVEVLLVGMTAPGNYGADYKAAFDALYPELAEAYGALYFPTFFQGLQADGDLGAAQKFMQGDGIHPNSDGVIRIVASMGPAVAELVNAARSAE